MLKKVLIGIGIVLVLIQFIRPERNETNDISADISTKYPVSEDVKQILAVACNNCHSNKTIYPWYANLQPVAWWMNGHIRHGKGHLNFSEFVNLRIASQNHQFEEIIDVLDEGEMPLPSYTYFGLHKEANLTKEQKSILVDWAKTQMNTLQANYPPDSLIMPRRN